MGGHPSVPVALIYPSQSAKSWASFQHLLLVIGSHHVPANLLPLLLIRPTQTPCRGQHPPPDPVRKLCSGPREVAAQGGPGCPFVSSQEGSGLQAQAHGPGPAPHRPSSTLFQVLFRLWHLSSGSDLALLGGPAGSGGRWLPPSEVEPDSREKARRS